MAELVYRSVELRDFSTTNRWFEVVEGLYDGVQVRGVDVVIPALSGRYARNRIADFRVVRLHGWVYGDTEAAFRTNMEATMVAFNPVSDPANLVISTPLYGVASGTKTISARTVDVRIMQLSWLHAEVDAELHALGTPAGLDMSLYLTVYPATDPNGISLGTIDAATELTYMHVADGLGSGKVKINRHHTQAALLTQGRYCRVHSDAGVVGAFWLENGPVDLSSFDETGGEFIVWSGRGAIAILERGRLLLAKFAPSPPASNRRGSFDDPGVWRWSSAGGTDPEYYGGILARAVEEGKNQTGTPLAPVTVTFSRTLDSSGAAWDEIADEYTTPIGTSALDLVRQFTGMGIIAQVNPNLQFSAWNRANFGTSRVGAFGLTTVRFEKGVNIADAIRRDIHDWQRVSHLLVEYADNQYVTVTDAAYPVDAATRWGFLSHTETADAATATKMGQENIAARKRRSDMFSFPLMAHGSDPTNGLYEPGPTGHFWVGDSITLHTGTGTYDVNAASYLVSAITWTLLENGDYDVIVEIGQGFHWTEGVGGSSPSLCCGPEAPSPGAAAVPGAEYFNGTMASNCTLGASNPVSGSWTFDTASCLSSGGSNDNQSANLATIGPGAYVRVAGEVQTNVNGAVRGFSGEWAGPVIAPNNDQLGASVFIVNTASSSATWTAFDVTLGPAPAGTVGFRISGESQMRLRNLIVSAPDSAAVPADTTSPIGDTASTGTSGTYAPINHVHTHGDVTTGSHPAEDVTIADVANDFTATHVEGALAELQSDAEAHVVAVDPHTGYQKESEKGTANGYASLGAGALVPMAQLATGTPDGTKFVRDDGTLVTPAGGGMANPMTAVADIIVGGTAGAPTRLAGGTAGQFLRVNPSTLLLEYVDPPSGVTDEKTKISLNDTTPGYLNGKLVAGTGVTLTENLDGGNETLTIASSGGGGTPEEQFWATAAPGSPSPQDDEFDDASIDAKWTRVSHGTPKGTWQERGGALIWTQSAAGSAAELDVYTQARTISIGDYVEAAFIMPIWNPFHMGPYIGFSNGVTFGTSNAVGADIHRNVAGERYRLMLNSFPGMNIRGTDGLIVDVGFVPYVVYHRVKYEAANTWGLYVSDDGIVWRKVQSNYAYTMTPTHVICGVHMFGSPAYTVDGGASIRLQYFRVNAA